MKTLTPAELKARLPHVHLIDVRSPAEFDEIHIPGSRLLPLHQLNETVAREIIGSSKESVLICQSGTRARQAAQRLADAGANNITVLEGGVNAWESAGHEVNRGRKFISIERQVRIAAGTLVVTGVILGTVANPWFLLLSAFVGGGLIFAGLTDWCGMGLLLARMPWNNRTSSCCQEDPSSTKR